MTDSGRAGTPQNPASAERNPGVLAQILSK